jgi:protease-4
MPIPTPKRILPEFSCQPYLYKLLGDMDFKGLSAELMFFGIFRKTGVKWKVRHEIQSAVEPFLKMK